MRLRKRPRSSFLFVAIAIIACFAPLSDGHAQEMENWFQVDVLNTGLGEMPAEVDRSTPQGAMESFLNATRADNPLVAAHLLDLSDIPETEQAEAGRDLAEKLGKIIERRLWISWNELPDRPDAMQENGSTNSAGVGRPRRSLQLEILDLDDRPVAIRMNRVKPVTGDAAWVFSRQTVANIDALYEHYGPGWLERQLPDSWRRQALWSLKPWEFVALPVAIVISLSAFFLFRWGLGLLAGRLKWENGKIAAQAARTPLALFFSVFLLDYIASRALAFSAPIMAVLTPILTIAMAIAITLAALRSIDSILNVVTHRYVGKIDDEQSAQERSFYTSIYALRRVVLLVAFAFGAGLVLTQLHLFHSLGISLLASAGVLTVILGIAGQSVLGNILASLQIAIAKPIRIGDSVYYEGDWAYVEAIFYTFVRLRTWDDRRLIVPVRYFISNPFENWSVQDSKMTRTFTLLLDHSANVEALRKAYLEFASEDEDVMESAEPKVLVDDHDQNGQHVRFYATAGDPTAAWQMHARLREKMLRWVEENHPQWWPRERIVDVGKGNVAATAGGVDDAGG
ncbi:mechanosensitive ion channel family protein [Hoeflea sp. WL0058]|uniref:Mechanosensitive ion channel family protein n=1 Tax=Flavimaribacter sediminis TaxID=2865987 RepID=A0AAE2ZQS1_9HYPH|nr:mechanosensitive ion channel domain-containing protein [Flavimaribacter sediminis]MBW8639190.1 mechanosensitive ion channel family protein [Flavimaribacter sediminis]